MKCSAVQVRADVPRVHNILYTIHYTLYTIHNTLYIIHNTGYRIQQQTYNKGSAIVEILLPKC